MNSEQLIQHSKLKGFPVPSLTPGAYISEVWESDDCTGWRQWLASYDRAIAARGNDKLTNLDRWFRDELPTQIKGREPICIHSDELHGIVSWKMHRGVWRERNRHLVAGNSPEKVEETSIGAFAAIPDPRKPVALLATLAGVGPATASAALAAYAPHLYPFFDELVAGFIPGLGPVAFTLPYYLKYASALRGRADRLNVTCSSTQEPASDRTEWTAFDIAQALWTVGTLHDS